MPISHHTALQPTAIPEWMQGIAEFLPTSYQEQAHAMKAFVRVRQIGSVDDLLRALLCWAFAGLSLRQLGIWGTVQHIGSLSDRAWSKRLTTTHTWVRWLVGQLLSTTALPPVSSHRQLRVVDASNLRERHVKGSQLRLHTSYLLNEQRIDEIVVTTAKTGESLTHLTWKPGDLVIADRGYCRRRQIAYILQARADCIVRWYVHGLPVFTPQGASFDVAAWLTRLTDSSAETTVSDGASSFRLLACRLSPQAAQRARQKCRRKAQKNGTHVQDATLFFAGWFLLVTSLSSQEATFAQVLDLYRARWQIELLFKRIKQLLQVHRLPSFQQCVNETLIALLLCGWILLEAHHQRLLALTPEVPASLWQGQSLLVRTFRCQLFGTWSLSQIITSWSALQRYLRPGRPFGKRWSCESLLCSLETLLASA